MSLAYLLLVEETEFSCFKMYSCVILVKEILVHVQLYMFLFLSARCHLFLLKEQNYKIKYLMLITLQRNVLNVV